MISSRNLHETVRNTCTKINFLKIRLVLHVLLNTVIWRKGK